MASVSSPPAALHSRLHTIGQSVVVTWRYADEPASKRERWHGVLRSPTKIEYTGTAKPASGLGVPPIVVPFVSRNGQIHTKVCDWPPHSSVVLIAVDIDERSSPTVELIARPPPQEQSQRKSIATQQSKAWAILSTSFDSGKKEIVRISIKSANDGRDRRDSREPEQLTPSVIQPQPQSHGSQLVPDDPLDELYVTPDAPNIETAIPDDDSSDENDEMIEDLEDLVIRASTSHLPEEMPPPGFQCGNGSVPTVAALKGHNLVPLLHLPAAEVPAIALLGLAKSTILEHRRMLNSLMTIPTELLQLPIPDMIAEFLMRKRKERSWKWATTIKYMATMQGALANLPLHRRTTQSIWLKNSPVWTNAMRASARRAREELARQPKPASWKTVQQVLMTESNILCFGAILLAWMTCARVGCVRQLAKSDITMHPDWTMSICFRRGKGVLARGTAYTIHTGEVPLAMRSRFKRFLEERNSWLFPQTFTGSLVKNSLRRVDKQLEQRSLRRGSLQHLSRAPNMTDEVMLLFSGHASVKTLRRYLNWGTAAVHTRALMLEGGNNLLDS